MPQTTKWKIEYPSLNDPPNIPLDMQRQADSTERALDQTVSSLGGVNNENIQLTTETRTLLNWTFSIPAEWTRADCELYYEIRTNCPPGMISRVEWRSFLDGGAKGGNHEFTMYQPSSADPGGGAGNFAMDSANVLLDGITPGTKRITVTAAITAGPNNGMLVHGQYWYVMMHRTA